jgi:hypothetical protein
MRLRRWYSQFYASGEPKVSLQVEGAEAPAKTEAGAGAGAARAPAGAGAVACAAHGAADW